MPEYALMVALIAAVCIATVTALGTAAMYKVWHYGNSH